MEMTDLSHRDFLCASVQRKYTARRCTGSAVSRREGRSPARLHTPMHKKAAHRWRTVGVEGKNALPQRKAPQTGARVLNGGGAGDVYWREENGDNSSCDGGKDL